MKIVTIKTQQELDALPERFEEYTRIEIRAAIRIFIINKAWENSSVVAWENSSVEAWGNSSVEARENSSVVAWGNSSVVARENSSVVARENSSVVARENSSVEAWGNSSVEARGNSSVEAWENSSVVAWENSSVVAWGNSSVVAWGQALVRVFSSAIKLALHGFSILSIPIGIDLKFKYEKTCKIQRYETPKYFDREGVPVKRKTVILFKKVSSDFKTQEKTENETLWILGSVVTHPKWEPEKQECGAGKFHACSRPYFCDEFRSAKGDRYIAVQIKLDDLYEWPRNQQYPHKIAFRAGRVLYECDKHGRKL
jgi:hypothetical protein